MHENDLEGGFRPLPRIYLAGPSVFDRDPVGRGRVLKATCAALGAVGLYPMDGDIRDVADLPGAIREANMLLIRECDALVADMAPFRGPSMDPGTAYEMGVAAALGKPVVGYSKDSRPYVRRVEDFFMASGRGVEVEANGSLRDPDGMQVESFGVPLADNLMMARGAAGPFATAAEAIACAVRILRDC